jgi:hypothetical protein
VSLAGLDASGVVSIFSLMRVPHFVSRYDCAWSFPKTLGQTIDRLCTPQGHIEYGTSLWFENIVGHRSLAQEIVFG